MVAKKPPTALVTERETPLTVLEKIKKLDAERSKLEETRKGLLETAKTELLTRGQEIVARLKELGYSYTLSESAKKSPSKPVKGSGVVRERATPEGKVCPVCGFATTPVHDARTHRHEKEPKKPFTDDELHKRNLVRV